MLKGSRIGTRLVMGFLMIAALVALVGILSLTKLNKVLVPLTHDIPQGLRELEKTSYLDSLAQKIRSFNQILTDSAKNYAQTGQRQWKYRYQEFERKLDEAIKEALAKGGEEDARIFSEIRKAKLFYSDFEYRSLKLADAGKMEAAAQILENVEYWRSKRDYRKALERYVELRGKKMGDTLAVTSGKVDEIVEHTERLVQDSIHTVVFVGVFALVVALILAIVVSRSILKPISALQEGTQTIGQGNWGHLIRINSRDEFGQLADAFNDMTSRLKELYAGLEEKVREKTSELANKVEKIEEQNKILEMSKQATLNILEDLEQAKAKIEDDKLKYEAILASMGDGLAATDQEGRIIMMNKQAEVMLGIKGEDYALKDFADVIHSEDDMERPLSREQRALTLSLEKGKKVIATANYIRKDKSKFPVAISVSPIIRDGKPIGAIQTFRDISKEKEVDRMKTEFISTVSHELRTPLTVIREGVSLVIDEVLGPTTAEQKNFLDVALKDIDRLNRIINNLLDVAKIEAGKIEIKRSTVNIVDIARQVAETFQPRIKGKGLELKLRVPEAPVELYVDRDKMVQVFTNLIGNSYKFTEQGFIEIFVEDDGDHVTCGIADTGPGMSKENLEKVFSKFEQFGTKTGGGEKGTGLGLSIAQGIVNMHQGEIWVESELGKGTTFFFRLPKSTAKDLLKGCVVKGLRDAIKERNSFTLCDLYFKDYEKLLKEEGREMADTVMDRLEDAIKIEAQVSLEQMVREKSHIFVVLPAKGPSDAKRITEKVRRTFDEAIAKGKIKSKVDMVYQLASYPEDGSTEDELLARVA